MLDFLDKQWPQKPLDDSVFEDARLLVETTYEFDAPVGVVWEVLDADDAWTWLPFPGTGVRYFDGERGVGAIREMGAVSGWSRKLWVERERFWRYDLHERVTFGVDSGNWLQRLLVESYAEDLIFDGTPGDRTHLTWRVAITPRLLFRWAVYFGPLWRAAYRLSFDRPVRKRVARHPRVPR